MCVKPSWYVEDNYVEEVPSRQSNSILSCQEIPSILRNTRVRYHVHKTPQLICDLRHMGPSHSLALKCNDHVAPVTN
jgi:hypothetical protein